MKFTRPGIIPAKQVVELSIQPTPTNVTCFICRGPVDEWHAFDPEVCRLELEALMTKD